MADEQELQLSVKFRDDASPGLLALKQTMQQTGAAFVNQQKQNTADQAKHQKELEDHTKRIHAGFSKALDEFNKYSGKISGFNFGEFGRLAVEATHGVEGLAIGISALPRLFSEANESFKEFTDNMIGLEARSRSVGIVAGQFKHLADRIHELTGISEQAAEQKLASFFGRIQAAGTGGTAELASLGEVFTNPGQVRQMMMRWQRMRVEDPEAGPAKIITEARDFLRRQREGNIRIDPYTAEDTTRRQGAKLGFPELESAQGEFTKASEEQVKLINDSIKSAHKTAEERGKRDSAEEEQALKLKLYTAPGINALNDALRKINEVLGPFAPAIGAVTAGVVTLAHVLAGYATVFWSSRTIERSLGWWKARRAARAARFAEGAAPAEAVEGAAPPEVAEAAPPEVMPAPAPAEAIPKALPEAVPKVAPVEGPMGRIGGAGGAFALSLALYEMMRKGKEQAARLPTVDWGEWLKSKIEGGSKLPEVEMPKGEPYTGPHMVSPAMEKKLEEVGQRALGKKAPAPETAAPPFVLPNVPLPLAGGIGLGAETKPLPLPVPVEVVKMPEEARPAAPPAGALQIPGVQGYGSPFQRRRSEIESPVQLASLGIPQGIKIPEAEPRAPGLAETFFRQRAAVQEQTDKTEAQSKATTENTDQLRRLNDLLDPTGAGAAKDGKAPASVGAAAPSAATESVPVGNGIVTASASPGAHNDIIGPSIRPATEPASSASGAGKAGGGAWTYQRLLAGFKNSNLIGVVPRDGARFGIRTGSAEEWARFGTAVASAESGFNPNLPGPANDPGGSHGLFQYAHGQVPGRNAFDPDASVKAFIRDTESSVRSGSIRGGILGPRFETIGAHPERTTSRLGEAGRIASRAGADTTGTPMGTSAPGAAGDPTVPTSILTRARAVAFAGGPGAVERFMAAQGYPKHAQWCGDFASSVVKASGYKPPPGSSVASNWRRWGEVDPTPHPGDIAVRKTSYRAGHAYVPTGETGSHVTLVEGVDPKTGQFTGLGGNQGAFERQFPAGQYEFRRPPGGGGGIDVAGASALTGGADGGAAPAGGGLPGGIGAALGGGGFGLPGGGGFPGLGGLGLPGGINIGGLLGRRLGPFGGLLSSVIGGGGLGGILGGGGGGHGMGGGIFSMLGSMLDRGPLDRSILDRGSMTHHVEGSGMLDVNVAAPAGTSVHARGGGLFKKIRMSRQTQMEPTVTGPHTPGGMWEV